MKQKTKESIEWIKSTLNDWIKNKYYPLGKEDRLYEQERDSKDITNAINFLDSLPGLEEQLKHGGFIPDMNKTPCKDGDKVKVINQNAWTAIEEKEVYELKWRNYKFVLFLEEVGYDYDFDEELDFVKVEENDNETYSIRK